MRSCATTSRNSPTAGRASAPGEETTMQRTRLILITAAMLVGASAAPAAAIGFGDYLAYCAGGSPAVDNDVRSAALAACGVKKGSEAACSVLSGTPWVCSTGQTEAKPDQQCDFHNLTFEITAALTMP